MENLPDEKKIVDTLGKVEVLKVEGEELTLSLEAHNQVNIQPKRTILGAKIKVEDNGNVIPMITFDTKKLNQKNKNINVKELIDDAIEDYNEQV